MLGIARSEARIDPLEVHPEVLEHGGFNPRDLVVGQVCEERMRSLGFR